MVPQLANLQSLTSCDLSGNNFNNNAALSSSLLGICTLCPAGQYFSEGSQLCPACTSCASQGKAEALPCGSFSDAACVDFDSDIEETAFSAGLVHEVVFAMALPPDVTVMQISVTGPTINGSTACEPVFEMDRPKRRVGCLADLDLPATDAKRVPAVRGLAGQRVVLRRSRRRPRPVLRLPGQHPAGSRRDLSSWAGALNVAVPMPGLPQQLVQGNKQPGLLHDMP